MQTLNWKKIKKDNKIERVIRVLIEIKKNQRKKIGKKKKRRKENPSKKREEYSKIEDWNERERWCLCAPLGMMLDHFIGV